MTIYATSIPRSVSTDEVYLTTDINGDITIKDNSVDFTKWQRAGTSGEVFTSAGTGADANYGASSFVKLGSASITSNSASISVTFTARKHLIVRFIGLGRSSTGGLALVFNDDTGANYAGVELYNGSDAQSYGSANYARFNPYNTTTPEDLILWIYNISGQVKLGDFFHNTGPTAAASAKDQTTGNLKWANTSEQITKITFKGTAGNILANSSIEVWGSD